LLVFLPASFQETKEKAKWFNKPIAKKISSRAGFGFEIKEPSSDGLRIFGEPPLPYGIHFHGDLSMEPQRFDDQVEAARRLKPVYTILHGMKAYPCPPRENEFKFLSGVGAIEYRKTFEQFVDFAKRLKKMVGLPIVVENTPITDLVFKMGAYQPKLYFDLRIGTFSKDLLAVQEGIGCKIVLDIEHLGLSLNYIKRKFQYSRLPKIVLGEVTFLEEKILEQYGLFLKKGFPLVVPRRLTLEGEIKDAGAKIYHLSGCRKRIGYIEAVKDKIVIHAPIHLNDKKFRQLLRIILDQKPEILVLEVGGPGDNACWAYRSRDVQEKSFENLCRILDEEMK